MDKAATYATYTPVGDPERTTPRTSQFNVHDPAWEQLQVQDQTIKTRVRRLRIGIRTLAFACSVVVVSLMVDNLVVFYQTADAAVNDTRLWPEDAKLWPTYVTLGVAAISTILATATLCAYVWSTKAANRWNMARVGATIAMLIFTIVLWAIAAAGLESTSSWDGEGSRSLWSATCDATDDEKNVFSGILDFHKFCLMQSWGLVCAGIGIGLEGLTVITYIYVLLRMRHKRKMKRVTLTMNPGVYQEVPSPMPTTNEEPFKDQFSPSYKGYQSYGPKQ